jgi:putative membrane protein
MRVRSTCLSAAIAFGALAPACAADDDAAFARQAASSGLLEVELGNYAAMNAADPDVKRFGRAMVDEHTRVNQQLEEVARREGIRLQSSMSAEHREDATRLMSLQGPEFDEAYLAMMVEDHEKAVDAFGEQAEQNRSELDRWAASALPALREHLAQARELEAKESQERVSQAP